MMSLSSLKNYRLSEAANGGRKVPP